MEPAGNAGVGQGLVRTSEVMGPSLPAIAVLVRRYLSRWLREPSRRRGLVFAVAFAFAWAAHYLSGVRRIRLHGGRGGNVGSSKSIRFAHERLKSILRRCSSLHAIYWPPWFAHTALLQFTLLGLKEMRGRLLPRPYLREILTLKDGCRIALDWVLPGVASGTKAAALEEDRPVCVLLHGAMQDSASVTMIDPARSLASKYGMPVVVMNRRGYGGLDLVGDAECRLSMFGFDEDLDDVLQAVENRYPGRTVAIVGFSCGSGFAGRYVGKRAHASAWPAGAGPLPAASRGRRPKLLCTVLYDSGYDVSPDGAVTKIRPPYSWVLNWAIKYTYVIRHRKALSARSSSFANIVSDLMSPKAALRGGLKETYRATRRLSTNSRVDSSAWLEAQQPQFDEISIPTLLINSRDDPVCTWSNVESFYADICSNPNMVLADLERGAHGCKYGFWGWGSYVDSMIGDFVLGAWQELESRRAVANGSDTVSGNSTNAYGFGF